MARRDYKNAGSRPSGKRGGLFKVLFVGILLGLIGAGVMAWYLLPRDSDFRRAPTAPEIRVPPTAVATPKPAAPEAPAAPAPDPSNYTFYDILPGDKAARPMAPAQSKELWWLQVAALKNPQDAETLRGKLAALSLGAVVQATADTPPLHRVRVGPFKSQDAAESARETLTLNKFEARLLKEPATR
jgi:cell division protein FtsN